MAEGRKILKLRPEEAALIISLRRLEQGEMKVQVIDKVPSMGYEVEKRINFKKMAEFEGLIGEITGEIEKSKKAVNQ